jgi:hypothetical protein
MTYLTYLPIFLILSVVSLSFVFQNAKGIIYFISIFFWLAIRYAYYSYSIKEEEPVKEECKSFMGKQSIGFGQFVTTFTFFYLLFPMFMYKIVNWSLFTVLLLLTIADVVICYTSACMSLSLMIGNFILGSLFAIGTVLSLNAINPQLLFFNELSTKDKCSIPKQTQFKCSIKNKNGETISQFIDSTSENNDDASFTDGTTPPSTMGFKQAYKTATDIAVDAVAKHRSSVDTDEDPLPNDE